MSAKAASALVVFPTATGIGMRRMNSARLSGWYAVARWRADETCDWTRNRSAPCSAQTGPKRRAAPGVDETAAFDPAAWISAIRRAISSSRIGAAYASDSTPWISASAADAIRSSTGAGSS